MREKLILGVDPGETIGVALIGIRKQTEDADRYVLTLKDYTQLNPTINKVGSLKSWDWGSVVPALTNNILSNKDIDIIAIEDYRIRQDAALAHSNQRVLTSELIGSLETLAHQVGYKVDRIQPTSKGLWPDARLRIWLPEYFEVEGHELEHARDAIKLALCYIHFTFLKS